MPISAEQWRVSVGLVDASRSLRPRVTCQPKTNLTWTCLLTALLVAVLLTGNGLRGTGSGKGVSRGRGCGGELVPSLFAAHWRKVLLLLAGDVETNPGPVVVRDWLDESDLDLLMEELGPIDTMWVELGWTLDISDEQLEDIRTQCSYHGNHGDALRGVLQKWLPGPSHWGGIVHALRSIGKDRLCSELKVKYGLLEKSDLDLVTEELDGVSIKWYALGKHFGLDSKELDSIRTEMSPNPEVCLKEMLSRWMALFSITTTWTTVVAGLRTSVDSQLAELADHLEAKYCSNQLHLSDVDVVVSELSTMSIKWKNLGHQLGIRDFILNDIQSPYKEPVNCLRMMITQWLQQVNLKTWNHIVLALKSSNIAESQLGDYLKEIYVSGKQLGQLKGNEDALLPRHVQLTLEEEMHHLTVCERVIKEKGKLLLNILQCVMSGHPRVGKSTLLARLTGQQPSIEHPNKSQALQVQGGTPMSTSTGIAEKIIQVTVKKVAMVVAKALQPNVVWEVLTYDVEAIALLKAVTKAHVHGNILPKSLHVQQATNATESNLPAEIGITSRDCISDPQAPDGKQLQHFYQLDPKDGGVSTSKVIVPGFRPPLDIFKEALKNRKWGEVEAFLTDSLTIYFTDTGGQPEFQEVLPALISGPSIFFLVFKLTDDLNQKYRVQFVRSPTQETRPYESSFTVKETLLQSLASIASTCSYASYTNTKMVAIEPKVVLVGTHKDLATEAQIKAIQQELKDTLEQTEYYRQNMLQFASEIEPVITVNNISSDGNDAQKIRSIVDRIAQHPSFHIEVPLPWLVLSLALRFLHNPVVSYKECYSIANECGIDTQDELKEALWFLHTKLGIIRYFETVKELSDLVILNPQLIFGNITELISSTFIFNHAGPYAAQQFREIGMFSLNTIESLTKTSAMSTEHLSTVKLVKLLEHLHIIAPIRDASGNITRYFMPCVLSHATSSASTRDENCYEIPPLLITFRCGYCPKGVFSALIVHLSSEIINAEMEATWLIKEDEVSRNRITFEVGREFHAVSITTHATHLEISIHATTQASADKLQTSPHEVCNSIRRCIEEGIVAVSRCLHYNCESSFNFGFYCTCQSCSDKKDHPAVCRHQDPCVTKCIQSGVSYDLPDISRIWFGRPLPIGSRGGGRGKEPSHLDIGDLIDICDYLVNLKRDQIFGLGLVLGLHAVPTLDIIKETPTFLYNMLTAWLQGQDNVGRTGGHTWGALVKGLRHPSVAQNETADRIQSEKLH